MCSRCVHGVALSGKTNHNNDDNSKDEKRLNKKKTDIRNQRLSFCFVLTTQCVKLSDFLRHFKHLNKIMHIDEALLGP